MHAIETYGLTKEFNGTRAVDSLSLEIEEGELFGLLGPNGAGKTTTIYMLSTILLPSSGTAKILGFDVVKQAQQVREKIGLSLGLSSFIDRFTPREILEYYAMLYGFWGSEKEKRIKHVEKLFQIESFATNKQFRSLSTGMRQKVSLAKSLLNSPRVWFLDEPTVGLDVETARDVRGIIRELVASEGLTVLLTSHYLFEVEELCKRIAILSNGKLVTCGKPAEIKRKLKFFDSIHFKVNALDAKRLVFLSSVPGVVDVKQAGEKGESMLVRAENMQRTLGKLLEELEDRKIEVRDLEVKRPSLEDVFIKLLKKAKLEQNERNEKRR
jgi:ABC-2 type transport system ATP-binding protein